MKMLKEKAKERLLKKHPPMTEKQIEQAKAETQKTKDLYAKTMVDYEKNLMEYFEKTEPIINEHGKVLALMRYPSYDELLRMVPPELKKYVGRLEDMETMPELDEEKYADLQFEIMSSLIVKPKKSAEWWKEQKGIMRFLVLFNDKFAEIVEATSKQAENFRLARKGKR